jgi:hypothetical protein
VAARCNNELLLLSTVLTLACWSSRVVSSVALSSRTAQHTSVVRSMAEAEIEAEVEAEREAEAEREMGDLSRRVR